MPIGRTGPQDFVFNSTIGGQILEPSVVGLADGRFFVSWSQDLGGSDANIRGRFFTAGADPIGNDFVLNSTSGSYEILAAAAALPDTRVLVTWASGPANLTNFEIYGRLFDADGNPIGNDFPINTTTVNTQVYPTVTTLQNGRFLVTWDTREDGSQFDIRGRLLESDGTPVGNELLINTTTANDQERTTVIALADGRFLVAWQSDTTANTDADIRARLFNADGTPAGDDFLVNTTTGNNQVDPAATMLADGRIFIAWSSNATGNSDIRGRLLNADGSPAGSDFLVSTTNDSTQHLVTVAALPDGRFFAGWRSVDGAEGKIRGRVFDEDGSATGDDFVISTQGSFNPAVSLMADGRLAMAWQGTGGIGGTILDPNVFKGTTGQDTWNGSNLFDDSIYGGAGGDTLYGRGGNDTINGDAGTDNVYGGDGNDKLFGGADGDLLDGGAGNDTLNGGTADDTMRGGDGNDTYFVDNAADIVEEASGKGTDTVNSSVTFSLAGQYAEKLILTGVANINGTGNSLANTLIGNAGNNVLDGGTGADRMEGGLGNDTYYVNQSGDVVVEASGGGTDTVNSSVSFSLRGTYLERLVLTGSGNTDATGNALNNRLTGNSGDNELDGWSGADRMTGLGGNDIYFVDDAGDEVVEASGGGTDTVNSSVSFSLRGGYVERLVLTGSGDIDGTGNAMDNRLTGNSGDNVLNGWTGNDRLTGGGGDDVFLFNTALNASTNVDTITDFDRSDDIIHIDNAVFTGLSTGTLASSAFKANTSGNASDASDRIVYETDTGNLYFDADGNGAGAKILFAKLDAGLALTNADFVVV